MPSGAAVGSLTIRTFSAKASSSSSHLNTYTTQSSLQSRTSDSKPYPKLTLSIATYIYQRKRAFVCQVSDSTRKMHKGSITTSLNFLGINTVSQLYKDIRKDILQFLKQSVNIHQASSDELEPIANNYLTTATESTGIRRWVLDPSLDYSWSVAEHRPEIRDHIWSIMACMQRYALDTLHRSGSGPCPGCRTHSPPRSAHGKSAFSAGDFYQHLSTSQKGRFQQVGSDLNDDRSGFSYRPMVSPQGRLLSIKCMSSFTD